MPFDGYQTPATSRTTVNTVGAAATAASRLNSRAPVGSIARPVIGSSHAYATPPEIPR